jgi:hypothetical protein
MENSKTNCINRLYGAGDGNRTHVRSLGCSAQWLPRQTPRPGTTGFAENASRINLLPLRGSCSNLNAEINGVAATSEPGPAPPKLPSTCLRIFISSLKSSPANKSNGRLLLGPTLQDGSVTICRAAVSVTFPSRFMLAAAMNPCPCGYFGDPMRECHCTPPMIQRYVSKISGPLLDRIDIHIEVPAGKYKELRAPSASEDSAAVRQRVIAARDRQLDRFRAEKKKTYANA